MKKYAAFDVGGAEMFRLSIDQGRIAIEDPFYPRVFRDSLMAIEHIKSWYLNEEILQKQKPHALCFELAGGEKNKLYIFPLPASEASKKKIHEWCGRILVQIFEELYR